jgi:hypothetical protein
VTTPREQLEQADAFKTLAVRCADAFKTEAEAQWTLRGATEAVEAARNEFRRARQAGNFYAVSKAVTDECARRGIGVPGWVGRQDG